MVLTIYHDLNATTGNKCLKKLNKKDLAPNKLPYKTEVATIFLQMLLILLKNKNVPLHPNSS